MATLSILVLDPHRELVDAAGEVLADAGYRVIAAESLESAMAALDSHPEISLAVCHATLKYRGGADQVPILGELAQRPHIGLVVISARPFEDVRNIPPLAVRLAKPFGARELLEAVASAAERQGTKLLS